ncbi:MAG: NAD(P)/FAD-dependent oxidoreductase [Patescibacteria group bacterium]|jgi:thioredoxin reductase
MDNFQDKTIIIGGGPAGSSAAIYLARFCHEVILFDVPEKITGRTAVATNLKNFLGHAEVTPGQDFLRRIREQIANLPIECKEERVTTVRFSGDGFDVVTEEGNKYQARYVIVAVGVVDPIPPIDIPDEFFDHSVFHCPACDWYQNRRKKIAVVGNNDRTISEALIFKFMRPESAIAVILSDKASAFSAGMMSRAKKNGIDTYVSPISQLQGDEGYLEHIILEDGTRIQAEAIFTMLGHERLDRFLDEGGIEVERDDDGYIKVDFHSLESSHHNLFAVGPCNNGPDQAIIAGGEGALAAFEIHRRILTNAGL